MATKVDQLVRELRTFRERRDVINAMSRGIRAAAKPVRAKIKSTALEVMPKSGGLNKWVARIGILAQVKVGGRRASIKLKGGRNSQGGRADLVRIDAGRVRAPSWGHKTKAGWHNVAVPAGFFTDTAADATEWRAEVEREVDQALDTIRRG